MAGICCRCPIPPFFQRKPRLPSCRCCWQIWHIYDFGYLSPTLPPAPTTQTPTNILLKAFAKGSFQMFRNTWGKHGDRSRYCCLRAWNQSSSFPGFRLLSFLGHWWPWSPINLGGCWQPSLSAASCPVMMINFIIMTMMMMLRMMMMLVFSWIWWLFSSTLCMGRSVFRSQHLLQLDFYTALTWIPLLHNISMVHWDCVFRILNSRCVCNVAFLIVSALSRNLSSILDLRLQITLFRMRYYTGTRPGISESDFVAWYVCQIYATPFHVLWWSERTISFMAVTAQTNDARHQVPMEPEGDPS